MKFKFSPTEVSKKDCLTYGIEEISGDYYLSIPVTNPMVDYSEYYKITSDEYEKFKSDINSARTFADECRKRKHDPRLFIKPGSMRGVPREPEN